MKIVLTINQRTGRKKMVKSFSDKVYFLKNWMPAIWGNSSTNMTVKLKATYLIIFGKNDFYAQFLRRCKMPRLRLQTAALILIKNERFPPIDENVCKESDLSSVRLVGWELNTQQGNWSHYSIMKVII